MKSPYTDSLVHTTRECKYHNSVCSEIYKKRNILKIKTRDRNDIERIVKKKRGRNNKCRGMSRPYIYVCKYTAQSEYIIVSRVLKRKKYINDI